MKIGNNSSPPPGGALDPGVSAHEREAREGRAATKKQDSQSGQVAGHPKLKRAPSLLPGEGLQSPATGDVRTATAEPVNEDLSGEPVRHGSAKRVQGRHGERDDGGSDDERHRGSQDVHGGTSVAASQEGRNKLLASESSPAKVLREVAAYKPSPRAASSNSPETHLLEFLLASSRHAGKISAEGYSPMRVQLTAVQAYMRLVGPREEGVELAKVKQLLVQHRLPALGPSTEPAPTSKDEDRNALLPLLVLSAMRTRTPRQHAEAIDRLSLVMNPPGKPAEPTGQ